MVPLSLFLICLNVFLCAFTDFYCKKTYELSHFPRDDFYGISVLFEKLKKEQEVQKVKLLKLKRGISLGFCWSGFQGSTIALSESFLENFDKKEITFFLLYAFKSIKSGNLFFLSLLSSFLFIYLKIAFILSYPLISFRKRDKKQSFLEQMAFKILSFISKPLFYKLDKNLVLSKKDKREQAFFLLNLDSFMRFQVHQEIPLFLSPLFLVKPFLDSINLSPLQPDVKNRIKKLTKTYPP
ncbi:MAG: hypothetical protein GDA46_01030 [Bdellovibrionales bacterium]|nr:hypothetical protein [Bdellovibrionales bacterium]